MKVGSLFSGGGLGDFGFLMAGMEIAWQVEIDEYCQKILELRYPESKKYRDIKTLKGADLEKVDIITGGFPCQPFSVAGKRRGNEDNRYLWPEMFRVIKECKPRWVVGENVPGIINMALDTVCSDLEGEGYEVWPIVFPACALEASHQRDRLWIMGYSEHNGQFTSKESRSIKKGNDDSPSRSDKPSEFERSSYELEVMGNARLLRQEKRKEQTARFIESSQSVAYRGQEQYKWENSRSIKSRMGRAVDDVTSRVDRLKMLGNGQTPCSTYVIGKWIMDIEHDKES